ncbi:UDP-N-acetylmuramate--L-alanine ligase [Capillibacterium thermochitinicola]|uniref:UDP-N-acetylmuramate--L-alanine ligase n=1 Tax=Capillibacterium thermochitinicola TaxID=2699427 RepID=UPI001E59826D|nr:UDP-N-acetylmuramate--L-alanine ligase [Capillibacterium thermochitinicola]
MWKKRGLAEKGRIRLKPGDHLYFIGIGGARLSALAKIMLESGYKVTGSDRMSSRSTRELETKGIKINYGHQAEQITDDIDAVIYTNAVGEENPELLAARAKGLPLYEGAELLGLLMKEKGKGIAVAGTHGKTTTTAMISLLLIKGGKDPTVEVGGEMKELPGNHRTGKSPYFVVEACEFRRSFLYLSPKIAVVTNVDWDHPDCFPTAGTVVDTFKEFIALVPPEGKIVLWQDDPNREELLKAAKAQVLTFGLTPEADWYCTEIETVPPMGTKGKLYHKGNYCGDLVLQVPGEHNIRNALAALIVALEAGVPLADSLKHLQTFTGVRRRFELKGEAGGVVVVDDYAHHPVAIRQTLATAKNQYPGRVWCVFQPHLYSRTKYLFSQFAQAFGDADVLVLADIYAAREVDRGEVSSRQLADETRKYHPDVRYLGDMAAIKDHLLKETKPGDLVLTMGAGDIFKVGEEFLQAQGARG